MSVLKHVREKNSSLYCRRKEINTNRNLKQGEVQYKHFNNFLILQAAESQAYCSCSEPGKQNLLILTLPVMA